MYTDIFGKKRYNNHCIQYIMMIVFGGGLSNEEYDKNVAWECARI